MWKILRNYEKIVNIIKCLYDGSTSAAHVDGILRKEFLANTRVFQGDTLPPILFIIILDFVLQKREIITGLQNHPAKLSDLDFVDDMVLLDQDETEAVEDFQTIES